MDFGTSTRHSITVSHDKESRDCSRWAIFCMWVSLDHITEHSEALKWFLIRIIKTFHFKKLPGTYKSQFQIAGKIW